MVLAGGLVFLVGKLLIAGLGRGHLDTGIVNNVFYLLGECLSILGSRTAVGRDRLESYTGVKSIVGKE